MGREGENLPLARASRLARPTPAGVGRRAWRITRAVRLSFGNERAAPWCSPRFVGLRGRAAAVSGERRALGASDGVCHVAHPSREDRCPKWDETPARWLGRRKRGDRAVPGRAAPDLNTVAIIERSRQFPKDGSTHILITQAPPHQWDVLEVLGDAIVATQRPPLFLAGTCCDQRKLHDMRKPPWPTCPYRTVGNRFRHRAASGNRYDGDCPHSAGQIPRRVRCL
ncbi:hypothetical protein BSY17_4119 (plasmid) [Sphingobium sp. RAC03]|nr:hypothetical protein BSY17_4119 [Sphingobium sp. RAC03]